MTAGSGAMRLAQASQVGGGARVRAPGDPPVALREELAALFEAHRRELHVHCYRMTGSFTDAEDLTQEVFLRAWRNLGSFEGRSSPRTWLYRIATNACLDFLANHERRARPTDSIADTLEHETWIHPYPDRRSGSGDPADVVADADATDLYLTTALLHLPPRQRAAVIARDLIGFDAASTAAILGCTSAAMNSLLQRGRTRLRRLAPNVEELVHPAPSDHDQLIRAYVDAHQRADVDAIVALLHEDVRISMPPEAPCIGAREAREFFTHLLGPDGPGAWHLVPTRANGAPAIANYVREPGGPEYRALSIDVLRIERDRITGLHCFLGDSIFPAFERALVSDLDQR